LRGLLDNHPQLLVPPDEDYFVRHLSRDPRPRLRGMMTSAAKADRFYRELQKDGHLERVNTDRANESFGTENSIDLDVYYSYIREHHRRGSLNTLVRNHVEAFAAALGHREGDGRMRVFFCALQPRHHDLTKVCRLLSRSYEVRGIFLFRDPRAHLNSMLIRNPTLNLERFCQRQNRYLDEIERFRQRGGPALSVRFEDLITDTEAVMAQVCELAGIEFNAGLLETTQGGQPSVSNSSFGSSQGIDSSTLTRYRDTMSDETIAFLKERCRPELFWHGDS